MTIYLANALPNSWAVQGCTVRPVAVEEAAAMLCSYDHYQDYDDHIAPFSLRDDVVSLVGHDSTAAQFGLLLSNGATLYGKEIPVAIPENRQEVIPVTGDRAICGLFVSPRRLAKGERWTEEEMLSNIRWVLVEF